MGQSGDALGKEGSRPGEQQVQVLEGEKQSGTFYQQGWGAGGLGAEGRKEGRKERWSLVGHDIVCILCCLQWGATRGLNR